MGFLEDLTSYFWNWTVFIGNFRNLQLCWFIGGWGVFWDDDDGYMTNQCYNLMGG